MAKPSKAIIKAHDRACELLNRPTIHDEKENIRFVLENWNPSVNSPAHQGKNQAYFTPPGVANSLMNAMLPDPGRRIVDICAGIGTLTFAMIEWMGWWDRESYDLTAVEINPEYVEVGKKLFPYVTWVNANALDWQTWNNLGQFNDAISNPPFGNMPNQHGADTEWLNYEGPAGLQIAAVGLRVSDCGITLVLPQTYTPYRYSGPSGSCNSRRNATTTEDERSRHLNKFMENYPYAEWGLWSEDMDGQKNEWSGVTPTIEIINMSIIWEIHDEMAQTSLEAA